MKSKRAFTLVELIVVIGIIAALAAIVFPVITRTRRQVRASVCLSNLRQLGSASALYATDYDDHLPYAPSPASKAIVQQGNPVYGAPLDDVIRLLPDIRTTLKPYGTVSSVFHCPLDVFLTWCDVCQKPTWFEEYGSSYAYNEQKALFERTFSGFPAPADNLLFWDQETFHSGSPGSEERLGVLFADFHSKTIFWSQRTQALESDP